MPDRICRCLLAASLALPLAAPALAQGEPVPNALSPLVMTGSLRAEKAERFSVPETDNWQIQLKWLIEEGTQVEPGDVIARFDPGTTQESLKEDEEQLDAKRQEYQVKKLEGELAVLEKKGALQTAEAEYEKAKLDASVPEGVLNGKDYRERQLNLMRKEKELNDAHLALSAEKTNQAVDLASLEIDIADIRLRIERAEEELGLLEVRATSSGLVVHEVHPWWGRKVRAGDNLPATFPVARIPDLESLEIEAWVGEADVWQIDEGDEIGVTLDAFSERRYVGRVTSVAKAGEERELWGDSPYFKVRVGIDELDADMRPGMSTRCVLLSKGQALGGADE